MSSQDMERYIRYAADQEDAIPTAQYGSHARITDSSREGYSAVRMIVEELELNERMESRRKKLREAARRFKNTARDGAGIPAKGKKGGEWR